MRTLVWALALSPIVLLAQTPRAAQHRAFGDRDLGEKILNLTAIVG